MGYRYLKLRTPNLGFDETTAPGYYEPLRTLNVELLLIAPTGSNVRQTCAVLNGILRGLYAYALRQCSSNPKFGYCNKLQGFRYLYPKKFARLVSFGDGQHTCR